MDSKLRPSRSQQQSRSLSVCSRWVTPLLVLFAGCFAPMLSASETVVPNPNVSVFASGNLTLTSGRTVRSNNGQYTLSMQPDGNLVLYRINCPIFATGTSGSGSNRAVFQSDGNLVLYTASNYATWSTQTAGNSGSRLAMQDDGNLVIYSWNNTAIWSSGTAFAGAHAFVNHLVTGTNAHSKIVHPSFPKSDVVIADYDAVADFGADNTGQVDSSQAIQNALNQCQSDGGGTVWLPAGQYRVGTSITIPAFCYLRGDWCDPDTVAVPSTPGSYGTLILADVASSSPLQTAGSGPLSFPTGGTSVFTLAGDCGIEGLTIFYPNQSMSNVIPYGYAINVANGSIMCSIEDVTLINAYAGLIINPNPSTPHELARVKNFKGTALFRGVTSNNSSDADVYENMVLDNKYWEQSGSYFNPPAASTLNAYTRSNGIGFTFADLEQAQFAQINATNYSCGMLIGTGARSPNLSAIFINLGLTQCTVSMQCNSGSLDQRCGLALLGGNLQGSTNSILNNSGDAWVVVNQASISGAEVGNVVDGTVFPRSDTTAPPPAYPLVAPASVPRTSGPMFINTALPPYNIVRVKPNSDGTIPTSDLDATEGIQQALNAAAAGGGGVVYLPAGWYFLSTHLAVPANVELRGTGSGPNRDDASHRGGTVLFGSEGANSPTAETDPALITLNGPYAGVCGLRVFYPGNNLWPWGSERGSGIATLYPATIRGNGSSLYVRNVTVLNGSRNVDFSTNTCSQHFVEDLSGWASLSMVEAGNGAGMLRTIMSNGDFGNRNGFGIQNWITGPETATFNNTSQGNQSFILIKPMPSGQTSPLQGEVITNAFAYGPLYGLNNQGANTMIFNLGTDGLGMQAQPYTGYSVYATQPVTVMNVFKNGTGLGPTYGVGNGSISYYNYAFIGEAGH